MTAKNEQETTVSQYRDGETYVYSSNPVHVRRLRKNPKVTELEGNLPDDAELWGRFRMRQQASASVAIPAGAFDPLRGFKRAARNLTTDQKNALALRLATSRANRG